MDVCSSDNVLDRGRGGVVGRSEVTESLEKALDPSQGKGRVRVGGCGDAIDAVRVVAPLLSDGRDECRVQQADVVFDVLSVGLDGHNHRWWCISDARDDL